MNQYAYEPEAIVAPVSLKFSVPCELSHFVVKKSVASSGSGALVVRSKLIAWKRWPFCSCQHALPHLTFNDPPASSPPPDASPPLPASTRPPPPWPDAS